METLGKRNRRREASSTGASRVGVVGALTTAILLAMSAVSSISPAIATPIDTTYNLHHWVGADVNQDGRTDCFYITADPVTGVPDDVVTYDGLPEEIMTDERGTIPTVVETKTDNGDGTHWLIIDTSSPTGTDLFPGGIERDDTLLTDACFLIGFFHPLSGIADPLDWEGMDSVLAASISFLTDGGIVIGPIELDPIAHFITDPWIGLMMFSHVDSAGLGINGVHLEILVEKTPQGPVAACCAGGECIGDFEEASCAFQGGEWILGASCGADPDLPPPICAQAECSFTNGSALDDLGAPVSQFAPDQPFGAGAADDFILTAPEDNPCRISQVRSWMTHTEAGINPAVDYQGVNVTIYANVDPKGPGGRPQDDGTHTATAPRGIVYIQTIPMSAVTATPQSPSCVPDMWQLDIPVDIVLNKDTKYWLEVQPIMNGALGRVSWALSQNYNEHAAQRIFPDVGIFGWEEIPGNTDGCPDDTPPADTRRNLAFELFGEKALAPSNDNCEEAIRIDDGIIPFSTVGATTDGPIEPDVCDFFGYTDVGSDIWYEHTATCTGNLTVSLCGSEYDTKLALYAGCAQCPPLRAPVACDDDFCALSGPSQVTHPVVEGDCYTVRIGGWEAAQGKGTMTVRCDVLPPPTGACCDRSTGDCRDGVVEVSCSGAQEEWTEGVRCSSLDPPCEPLPPPHDECEQCIPVSTDVRYDGSSEGATGEHVIWCSYLLNDPFDVWHCWTADCSGTLTVSLCGSSYDTTLAVYDACGGTQLACNDDACGDNESSVRLEAVTAGETYYIRVSGYLYETGNYTLMVTGPCRDACCLSEPEGWCAFGTAEQCALASGVYLGSRSVCLGDQPPQNGVDDACELPLDINEDGVVDYLDWGAFVGCWSGPGVTEPPPGCLAGEFENADFEGDGDVDMMDAGIFLLHFPPTFHGEAQTAAAHSCVLPAGGARGED